MDGILLVDKPSGMTSHDVVDAIRKRFGLRKVGHAGTLDPIATGLLIILIGKATKKSKDFMNDDKTYIADIVFGIATDTGDKDGRIIAKNEYKLEAAKIEKTLEGFRGEIEQIPPMFSAKKYKGLKLYEYARIGINLKREPMHVTIKRLEVLNFENNRISLLVHCSKGTYIRQLAIDVGEKLGCGAHLFNLRRINSGRFDISQSINFGELEQMSKESLNENLIRD